MDGPFGGVRGNGSRIWNRDEAVEAAVLWAEENAKDLASSIAYELRAPRTSSGESAGDHNAARDPESEDILDLPAQAMSVEDMRALYLRSA